MTSPLIINDDNRSSLFINNDATITNQGHIDTTATSPANFINRIQQSACLLSHALALVLVLLVSIWVNEEALGGGGVSWSDGQPQKVFNWHPVLMISAFSFMTVSSLSFRSKWMNIWIVGKDNGSDFLQQQQQRQQQQRQVKKVFHIVSWIVVVMCGGIAMMAVVKSHNDPVTGYIANLYSMHSWCGCAVMGIYILQFMVGMSFFSGMNLKLWRGSMFGFTSAPIFKSSVMSIHKFMGSFIYVATGATILMGIQEKEGFMKCSYNVDQPDINPIMNVGRLPTACKISHSLGVCVLALILCTTFALHDFAAISRDATSQVSHQTDRRRLV